MGKSIFNTNGVWMNPETGEIYDAKQIKTIAIHQLGAGKERIYAQKLREKGFDFFSSKLEANCYLKLLGLFEKNEIILKPKIQLIKPRKGLHRGVSWSPDFLVCDPLKATKIYVEAKGFETEVYRLKRVLLIELEERSELIVCKKPDDVNTIKLIHSKYAQNPILTCLGSESRQLKLNCED